jgi:hypothetical protein
VCVPDGEGVAAGLEVGEGAAEEVGAAVEVALASASGDTSGSELAATVGPAVLLGS